METFIIIFMIIGLIILSALCLKKGYDLRQLGKMIISGINSTKTIPFVFILIGALSALWRACGTIPLIICYAVRLINPKSLLLLSFILNCAVSVLTGTALGTAATMGIICMTMAVSLNINTIIMGGAILAGCYFGDRCSPVSTSALLVSELTQTNIFENIKEMIRTAFIPFILSCLIYAMLGFFLQGNGSTPDLSSLFAREINLHLSVLLPAVIIFTLSLLRVNVKKAMTASILTAIFICLRVQNLPFSEVLAIVLKGYKSTDSEIAAVLNGGGIISIFEVMIIVFLSSSYAGIFRQTDFLNNLEENLQKLSGKITVFGSLLLTSIIISLLVCNQTLTIMLTHQLFQEIEKERKKLAVYLENSAVVIPPLIPWSIAGAIPLATIEAPTTSIFAACFLYILPIYTFLKCFWEKLSFRASEESSLM